MSENIEDDYDLRVRVGETPYGQGLYATQDLPAGRILGQVHGSIVLDPDYDSPYCIELIEDVSLEPEDPFALLNHGCDPNCALVWIEGTDQIEYPDGTKRVMPDVIVETLAPIRAGEQLTIDYRWPAEAAIPCRCRSANCRGWIVAAEELDQLIP